MTDFEKRVAEGMTVLWGTWNALKVASELRDISDNLKKALEKVREKKASKNN